jgi:hypothetical protein
MKPGLRAILAVSLPGVLLLLGLAFPQIVLHSIILPTATVLWLLLRVFVLSINQQVYWWGAIALAVLAAIVVLLRGSPGSSFHHSFLSSAPWDPTRRWRDSLLLNVRSEPDKDTFRLDLAWMLTSLHASSRPGFAKYQIREAFVQGMIPLPPSIYAFLFSSTKPRDPVPPFLSHPFMRLRMAIGSLGRALQRRARFRSGQETADYFHSIDEVLSFMETSLEMNHELELEAEPQPEPEAEPDA